MTAGLRHERMRARARIAWAWAQPVAAVATLAAVVWQLGTGPFRAGVGAVDAEALAAAVAIGFVTIVCCAWRWTVVARGLGVRLSLPAAVAAYYRSVFLNLTLPGGVVGDVHRGLSHGRGVRDVAGALRAVVWERAAGQAVQVVLTVAVLLAAPSPVRDSVPPVAAALAAAALVVVLVDRAGRGHRRSRWGRIRHAVAGGVRGALLARRALPAVVVGSTLVVVGQAATFVIAARSAGVTAPLSHLVPLALLAMLAMVLPSVAGWGPREGGAAWVFGAAGLGADAGVSTAVAYGVMVLVASLPGALVLAAAWLPRPPAARMRPGGAADA